MVCYFVSCGCPEASRWLNYNDSYSSPEWMNKYIRLRYRYCIQIYLVVDSRQLPLLPWIRQFDTINGNSSFLFFLLYCSIDYYTMQYLLFTGHLELEAWSDISLWKWNGWSQSNMMWVQWYVIIMDVFCTQRKRILSRNRKIHTSESICLSALS